MRVYVEEQGLNFVAPLGWSDLYARKAMKIRLVLDIDRYQTGVILSDQLSIEDWIKKSSYQMKKEQDSLTKELFRL